MTIIFKWLGRIRIVILMLLLSYFAFFVSFFDQQRFRVQAPTPNRCFLLDDISIFSATTCRASAPLLGLFLAASLCAPLVLQLSQIHPLLGFRHRIVGGAELHVRQVFSRAHLAAV